MRRSAPTSGRSAFGTASDERATVCSSARVSSTLGASSSFATAASTSTSRVRDAASATSRSSSERAARRSSAGPAGAAPAVSTWTRSPTPSREPRGLRFGHTPSCSPASTTVSNSSPATPTGVVTSTPSRMPRGARVSSGTSADSWAVTKTDAGSVGARSAARAAAVKSATTPSRSRLASAAPVPPDERALPPARGEAAALPDEPEQLLRRAPGRSGDADRLEGLREPGGAAREGRLDGHQPPGTLERVDEQLPGAAGAVARELLDAEREPQAPEREPVHAAERPREQVDRRLRA